MEKPDIKEVARIAPETANLREIGSGGFKVVYQAEIQGRIEALKLVHVPSDEIDESVREENLRRIEREIGVLKGCKTPFLVKLGSLAPRQVLVGGQTYVLYSEEYIPGESLRVSIKARYTPAIRELAVVGDCLLRAVDELSARAYPLASSKRCR